MSRKTNSNKTFIYRYLALVLVLAALISATVSTLAWLQYKRSLQTMTKVQFSTLNLTDIDMSSAPIDLGEIDWKKDTKTEMPFLVQANPGTKYILQIGHTTNLPLTYTIKPLGENNAQGTPIEGSNLNLPKNSNSNIADKTLNPQTYSDGDQVQQNAEPVYWQSVPIQCGPKGADAYVLIVSWDSTVTVIDKDTEMIYLTAGIGGYETNETTQTTP